MCGGKYYKISQNWAEEKLINSVINNPDQFGTAMHTSLPLSCTVTESMFTAICVSSVHKKKHRYVYVSSSDIQLNSNQ